MPSWTPGSGTRGPAGPPAPTVPATTSHPSASGSHSGAWPAPMGARRSRARGGALGRAMREVARFARRKPLGALGGAIVVGMLLMAAFADGLAPYGYEETIRGARFRPPSAAHWLGTDNLGRDLWSRIVYGARVSVTVGFATIALGTLVATVIGVSSGYLGGTYDLAVQRVVDAWMSFPYLVIVLSVMAVLGPGLLNIILSLAVITAATSSRVIRGATIAVARQPHVEAARAVEAGHLRVVLRHVLPNV